MLIKILNDIAAYTGYLHEIGLSVSIHDRNGSFFSFSHIISEYNLHKSPYCLLVKSSPCAWKHCIERQHKIYDRIAESGEPFFGMCYAGAEEFVFPIGEGDAIGFVSVGGYGINRSKAEARIRSVAEKYMIPEAALTATYDSGLKHTSPDMEWLRRLINPLCYMLLLLKDSIPKDAVPASPESAYAKAMVYINRNYTSHISMKEISRATGYSVSSISHIFRKKSGFSLSEYIAHLRVIQAKNYLAYTDLSMQEISDRLGFSDQNYFTNTFKKLSSVSPREYRRLSRSSTH